MNKVLLVGGEQQRDALGKQEWHAHRCGVLLALDLTTGETTRLFEYESPADARPTNSTNTTFKAASLSHDLLTVCTQTEVLQLDVPSLNVHRRLTHPLFNDVHHATPMTDGSLLVANTGLDMVLQFGPHSDVLNTWSTLSESPWARFHPHTDYRKVESTKPHASHPNYVFLLDGSPWVTRFEQRDAVNLTDFTQRFPIDIQRPHDGVVAEQHIYFTTVDGHVVRFRRDRSTDAEIYDLRTMKKSVRLLGWCRSILPLGQDEVLVGFTRLRPTKWTENISWSSSRALMINAIHRPARIAHYDLRKQCLIREYPVEDAGLNAIFSILPWS